MGQHGKAAMGAGLIVGVMALIKLLLAQAHLPCCGKAWPMA
jgi:site-specific recombinase